jgi:hypothetical protein
MNRRLFLGSIASAAVARQFPGIPREYLREADSIPSFWVSSLADVQRFLDARIHRGQVQEIGRSAGKRPLRAVFYGRPRAGKGTTTYSGSAGFGDVRAWLGPDFARKVYFGFAGVHGFELEGIVGMMNLLAVLETGDDLRGKPWPQLAAAARALDRVILLPVTNVDGRARVPIRMLPHRGRDGTVNEYFDTGGKPDGTLIGWPQCKEYIPLDFSKTQFPGGYPKDAGVNIQHDDFLGARQPETQALFDLVARERPDLTLNMHTGAAFIHVMRGFLEPALEAIWEQFYRRVMTALTAAGTQHTADAAVEANPAREKRQGQYNLDSALSLHSGALAAMIESPSHSFSNASRGGKPYYPTPDELVDAQLVSHQAAMMFLAETGGRARWTPTPARQ